MTKKATAILLVVICIVGSLVTFYGTNLLMSDLANMYYTSLSKDIISSFPFFIFSLDFVLATLFVVRLYKHFDQKKALVNLYTILLAIFSVVGIVFSILTGTMIYGSFFVPYPFFMGPALCLLVHIVLLVGAIVANVQVRKKVAPDTDHRKVKLKYIGYTLMFSLLTFYAYNRFGALLMAVIYAQARTLYLTFPFYLSLLLPLALLIYVVGNFFDWYKGRPKLAVILPVIMLLLDIMFTAIISYIGYHNTLFISAISPALGLERLATKPYDTILQFAVVFVLTAYYAIFAAIYNRKIRRKAKAQVQAQN